MSTYPVTNPLLLLKGTARVMRVEAADARAAGNAIQPDALEQYAALIDSARAALDAKQGGES